MKVEEKIIFLDIDGPVIPYRCMFLPGQTVPWTVFDPVAVSLINELCANDGWRIVIHSSWIRHRGGQFTRDHCIAQGILAEHFHPDAWCDGSIKWRYTRIAKWLSDHPDVKTYAIVDDDAYEPDKDAAWEHPADVADHVVKINYYTGMMFMDYIEVCARGVTDVPA